jgi:hypothetical protein
LHQLLKSHTLEYFRIYMQTLLSRYSDRLKGRGSIPGRAKIFLFSTVQTAFATHPALDPLGNAADFPGGKAAGA